MITKCAVGDEWVFFCLFVKMSVRKSLTPVVVPLNSRIPEDAWLTQSRTHTNVHVYADLLGNARKRKTQGKVAVVQERK